MAPNKKSNVGPSLGSEHALPVRYRCKVGGEWKSLQFFSKNQQQLIQRQTSLRGGVDAANSGMTCIEHSVGFRGEIRCDLCGLIQSIDMFSKSMRKSDEPTCLRCTAWVETQEPGVTPIPLATGHRSVEEQDKDFWGKKLAGGQDFSSDPKPQAPSKVLSSLGISDGPSSGRISPEDGRNQVQPGGPSSSRGPSSVVSVPVSVASSGPLPPHLESIVGKLMRSEGLIKPANSDNHSQKSISSTAPVNVPGWLAGDQARSVVGSEGGGSEMGGGDAGQTTLSALHSKLPPHLHGGIPNMASRATLFQPAVPSITGSQGSDARTISTATTMRSDQDTGHSKPRIPYNAWDNVGKLHEAIKSPTASEGDTASTASNLPAQDPSASGQWENVPATKKGGFKSRKSWHTAPRLKQHPPAATDHISTQYIDPKIEHQKNMTYCDSEDSRY